MFNTLTAPVIDRLLFQFDTGFANARSYSKAVTDAMEPLFSIMSVLAPLPKNDEVKMIWLKIPRGTLEDFGDFQQMLDDIKDGKDDVSFVLVFKLSRFGRNVCNKSNRADIKKKKRSF